VPVTLPTINSDFLLLQTILPNSNERRNAILAVVHQYDPTPTLDQRLSPEPTHPTKQNSHAIRVHALPNKKIIVLEIRHNLLRIRLRARLKRFDGRIVRAIRLHGFLNVLHVVFQMRQVGLLVELRRLQAERVHHVVDGLRCVLCTLFGFFGGGVGASVCRACLLSAGVR